MEFAIRHLSDAEVQAELNRSKGRQAEWPKVLSDLLASDGCSIDKPFGIAVSFEGRKNTSAVAGLRKAAKAAGYSTLVFRPTPDTEDSVNITNSVKAK